MKSYAMVLLNRVIGVLNYEEIEPHWPPDPSGNRVETIEIKDNQNVELGMIYDFEANTFKEYIPEPISPVEPEETQSDRIEKMVSKLYADIKADAIDAYTYELMKEGML